MTRTVQGDWTPSEETSSETKTAWLKRPSLGGFPHGAWIGIALASALLLAGTFVLGYTVGHLRTQAALERATPVPPDPSGVGSGGSGSTGGSGGGSGTGTGTGTSTGTGAATGGGGTGGTGTG
ncbi:hypothetical protein [Pseudonocardia charpentierae]|uniref:Uncharacterized protein n=1 Tax=Pseudonocardia charpentierae TaxID=3075545 RepID=A0ABU2N5R6_9PSEU|nr:hypothetical protein [Pseudonocardia sp. DSM 45834]MDT0349281.1 hypothetical protein [Pseudonocardia sp. DSM 45834]